MTALLNLLSAKALLYLAGGLLALVIGLLLVLWFEQERLDLCRAQVETLEARVQTLRDDADEYRRTIDQQNSAVEGLERAAKARSEAATTELAQVRAAAAKAEDSRRRLAALIAQPTPRRPDDSGAKTGGIVLAKCDEAVAAVRKELKW